MVNEILFLLQKSWVFLEDFTGFSFILKFRWLFECLLVYLWGMEKKNFFPWIYQVLYFTTLLITKIIYKLSLSWKLLEMWEK